NRTRRMKITRLKRQVITATPSGLGSLLQSTCHPVTSNLSSLAVTLIIKLSNSGSVQFVRIHGGRDERLPGAGIRLSLTMPVHEKADLHCLYRWNHWHEAVIQRLGSSAR